VTDRFFLVPRYPASDPRGQKLQRQRQRQRGIGFLSDHDRPNYPPPVASVKLDHGGVVSVSFLLFLDRIVGQDDLTK